MGHRGGGVRSALLRPRRARRCVVGLIFLHVTLVFWWLFAYHRLLTASDEARKNAVWLPPWPQVVPGNEFAGAVTPPATNAQDDGAPAEAAAALPAEPRTEAPKADAFAQEVSAEELQLRFTRPAQPNDWTRALPVGNGRLGALLAWDPWEDRIALSDDTLFAGAARHSYGGDPQPPPDSSKRRAAFSKARAEIAQGSVSAIESFASKLVGGVAPASFEYAGDVWLRHAQEGPSSSSAAPLRNYERHLDLRTGVSGSSFEYGLTDSPRRRRSEAFVSAVDQVMVLRLECAPSCLDLSLGLGRAKSAVPGSEDSSSSTIDAVIGLSGGGGGKLSFHVCAAALPDDGGSTAVVSAAGAIDIRGGGATLLIAAASSFRLENPRSTCVATLNAAAKVEGGYAALRQRHVKDFAALFDRIKLRLWESGGSPTAERMKDPTAKGLASEGNFRSKGNGDLLVVGAGGGCFFSHRDPHKLMAVVPEVQPPEFVADLPWGRHAYRWSAALSMWHEGEASQPTVSWAKVHDGSVGDRSVGDRCEAELKGIATSHIELLQSSVRLYQFGRYLLLSSSRVPPSERRPGEYGRSFEPGEYGAQPPNLQGLWADGLQAQWSGKCPSLAPAAPALCAQT